MKEESIRPASIFSEFLRLAARDAENFPHQSLWTEISCPACQDTAGKTFLKHNFTYKECSKCGTLYATPRPSQEAFNAYYKTSESVKYWATDFYKSTQESRRQQIWRPKVAMILEILREYQPGTNLLIDIGGGYGIFAEEFSKNSSIPVTVIEPSPPLADASRARGLTVVAKFLEELLPSDVPTNLSRSFVSFELIEHLHDPSEFFISLSRVMKSGEIFVFTTLASSGLDIQVLWEKSDAVHPPHHLNFFTPNSIGLLLEKCGFNTLSAETPGKLDLQILKKNIHYVQDKFWQTFLNTKTDQEILEMQNVIAKLKLSSHMLIVCQKS